LQREYEDRFALTYDNSPQGLYERVAARQQLQERVRTVLGDELFGSWLFGEGEDYALMVAFASRHSLAPTVPFEVWRVKNEYTLRRLEIAAQPGISSDQVRALQAALAQQIEARLVSILGPGPLQAGRSNVLGWAPKR